MSLQPNDGAAEAFERLRLEVALLRRAVEGVAAQADTDPVDYSPTLAALSDAVAEVAAQTVALGERPLLALGPEHLGQLLHMAGSKVLARSLAALHHEREQLARATDALNGVRAAKMAASRSWRRALALLGAGAVAGVVLWSVLLGPMARALPAAWAVPERLAAATLNVPLDQSGARLLRRTEPEAWATLGMARRLTDQELASLGRCLSRVEGREAKTCTVKVSRP